MNMLGYMAKGNEVAVGIKVDPERQRQYETI